MSEPTTPAIDPRLNVICDYQGYEFGAPYPDSICMDGQLYDADDCDDQGNMYEPTEDIPCPMCRERDAIAYWADRLGRGEGIKKLKQARSLVADIRNNRINGTEPWKKEN